MINDFSKPLNILQANAIDGAWDVEMDKWRAEGAYPSRRRYTLRVRQRVGPRMAVVSLSHRHLDKLRSADKIADYISRAVVRAVRQVLG